jgi:hypothetical protein
MFALAGAIRRRDDERDAETQSGKLLPRITAAESKNMSIISVLLGIKDRQANRQNHAPLPSPYPGIRSLFRQ